MLNLFERNRKNPIKIRIKPEIMNSLYKLAILKINLPPLSMTGGL